MVSHNRTFAMLNAFRGIPAVLVFSTTELLFIRYCLNMWVDGWRDKLTGRQTDRRKTAPFLPCAMSIRSSPQTGCQVVSSHPPALFLIYTIVSCVFSSIHHCGAHAELYQQCRHSCLTSSTTLWEDTCQIPKLNPSGIKIECAPNHCCHFFGLLGVLMVQSGIVTGVVLVDVWVAVVWGMKMFLHDRCVSDLSICFVLLLFLFGLTHCVWRPSKFSFVLFDSQIGMLMVFFFFQ